MKESELIFEVVGGLGNQILIYSTAKEMQEQLGVKKILFDIAYYSWKPLRGTFPRHFALDKFALKLEYVEEKQIKKIFFRTKNRLINSFLKRYKFFSKNFKKVGDALPKNFDLIYISGFKVNLDYIIRNIEMFRKAFRLREEYYRKINPMIIRVKRENSVSIHVRRGDLKEFKDGKILAQEYYKKAIRFIKGNVKNPSFYIFSDDMDWCKKNFKFLEKANFVEGNQDYEDFEIMKNCKHNIIANSTLSLIAAVLNKNSNKIIFVPKSLNNRERRNNTKINLPKSWRIIDE
jgi:hypothetical protein